MLKLRAVRIQGIGGTVLQNQKPGLENFRGQHAYEEDIENSKHYKIV